MSPAGQAARLAWRSVRRHRARTAIAVLSIGLGLALVVFLVSLRHGQYTQLVDRAVRLQGGHLTLEHPSYREDPSPGLAIGRAGERRRAIAALPQVERTRPVVLGQALVRSAAGACSAALVGVDPGAERGSSPLPDRIVAGGYLEEGDAGGIVVGVRLAEQLGVGPGKKVVLSVGGIDGQIVEELARVTGVFSAGSPEIDGFLVVAPLGLARRLTGLAADEVTQLAVILRDPRQAGPAAARIREIAGGADAAVRQWQEIMPEVASFVQAAMRWALFYQGLLLLLILLSVLTTLLVSVLERRREFAVLLAIGTPPGLLRLQVFAETALVGMIGCGLGLALGGGAAFAAQVHGIDLRGLLTEGMSLSGYAFDLVVRPRPTAAILLGLGGVEFAATLVLGLYPMRLAARVEPTRLLR